MCQKPVGFRFSKVIVFQLPLQAGLAVPKVHIVSAPAVLRRQVDAPRSGSPWPSHFHLSKMRRISFSAARAASSALISSRATLANMVLRTNVLTTSLIAFVA